MMLKWSSKFTKDSQGNDKLKKAQNRKRILFLLKKGNKNDNTNNKSNYL